VRRLLRRARGRCRDERGSVLVITAVAMVAMLGMAAFTIDVGSWYQVKRHVQEAADAAALAGAQDLPASEATATADATAYVTKNLPGVTPTITFPTSTEIKVVVSTTAPSFFGKVFGVTSANVSATSVASETSTQTTCSATGTDCYAMFAMNTSCTGDPITLGGGSHVIGGVWSDGSINVGGGGSSLGPTTYSNAAQCSISPSSWASNSNTFTSGPTAAAPLTAWPINYALDFPACSGTCTGPGGTPSFCTSSSTATSEYLKTYTPSNLSSDNIYCDVGTGTASTPTTWNGAIEVAGGPVTDTFVGGTVTIDGGTTLTACGWTLSGYQASSCGTSIPAPVTANYPLVYAVGSGTSVNDSSGGNTFYGDLFGPNGTIDIGGGSWTTFAEGNQINASGGGFTVTGDGPLTTGGTLGAGTAAESLTQ
jgi:Flp pilus assembly protein TadG